MFNLYLLVILLLLLLLTTFSLLVLCFSLYKKHSKTEQRQKPQLTHLTRGPNPANQGRETEQPVETDPTQLPRSARSLLLRLLPSDSPKWERLFEEEERESDPDSAANRAGPEEEEQRGKRKKKRAKKKSGSNPKDRDEVNGEEAEEEGLVKGRGGERDELVCLYPFTSSSSATQRKIKQQYDELMKCHRAKGLTFVQVGEFANCLVEAKNELQHKADVIQRKFTITKALLFKADRSSFDRLRQQIYKLELEQKRLEEDACVYNWLQQQLKLSPAYKKMLEIGARMELKAKSGELIESTDAEYSDISFEELLAQEKKDSFWQRNGKLRPCSG